MYTSPALLWIPFVPRPSSLSLAKDDILEYFATAQKRVYRPRELAHVLLDNREQWRLAENVRVAQFTSFLTTAGALQVHELRAENYNHVVIRYTLEHASSFDLALSIKERGYLSHRSAMGLHKLALLDPLNVYLNNEQSTKPPVQRILRQETINAAFARRQRQSNLIYQSGSSAITMIAGKNTNQLGVEKTIGPDAAILPVTNLERTLIDIVVRPSYSGGASSVLEAYRAASGRVSADALMTMLIRLDHAYPYHQAIGFLMQIAGYPERSYQKLKTPGINFDFYLDHGLKEPAYCKECRLYYPKALNRHK